MGKLHELLAVEPELEKAAKKVVEETFRTFMKEALFIGKRRTTEIFDSEVPNPADEVQVVTTTVGKKLRYVKPFLTRSIDASFQKELTNQTANATLAVGEASFEGLPATFLLGLEKRLVLLRTLIDKTPTLPPGKEYVADEAEEVFRVANNTQSYKTEKGFRAVVLYEATKEHPAQVEKVPTTRNVGMYTDTLMFGAISSHTKSKMLERCDNLIREVKQARSRANATKVKNEKIGDKILDYVLGDHATGSV